MTLSDSEAYRQMIGCLMLNPLLLIEYPDIYPSDFDDKMARICCAAIQQMIKAGAVKLTVEEVDQEMARIGPAAIKYYQDNHGLDFLKSAYEVANPSNFKLYYTRLKKCSLLRRLQEEKYDISEYYVDERDIVNPTQEVELQRHLDESSLEDILNSIESKYNIIRNEYLNNGRVQGDPAQGVQELIDKLKSTPSIGPPLEGDKFNTCCRGARAGCFFLKSASTSAGKTRTSVFDACKLAYPKRWSHKLNTFIEERVKSTGEVRPPRKVLFIVTEMDKEELQTIMLAYLSGVDEDKILRGKYDMGEEIRVRHAGEIMAEYSGYFLIEEISEPNLVNVQSTVKKYATVDNVKYVFFDYIHSTASMISQFSRNNIREDSILMLMANQLKQLAKDYNIFIFSATQVNMNAMADDGEFKNEMSIRGAKSISDKADVGYVMTRVTDKLWNSIQASLRIAVNKGELDAEVLTDTNKRPTHVLDIYKMRRGRYKNVRVWINLHLGTGYRDDLYVTTPENTPIDISGFTLYSGYDELPYDWEKKGTITSD